MSSPSKCGCAKPITGERSEQKGVSESYCGRCKKQIGLRTAALRAV